MRSASPTLDDPKSTTGRFRVVRHRNAILAAMLLLIHGAVWGDFDELQSRSLMLVHLGLFMLWQPLWSQEHRLHTAHAGGFPARVRGPVLRRDAPERQGYLSELPLVPLSAPAAHLSFHLESPQEEIPHGRGINADYARAIKKEVKIPVLCTGGFQNAALIRDKLAQGYFDGVTIARALIANRDLPKVWATGQDLPERPCTHCNKCLVYAPSYPLGCYELARYGGDLIA